MTVSHSPKQIQTSDSRVYSRRGFLKSLTNSLLSQAESLSSRNYSKVLHTPSWRWLFRTNIPGVLWNGFLEFLSRWIKIRAIKLGAKLANLLRWFSTNNVMLVVIRYPGPRSPRIIAQVSYSISGVHYKLLSEQVGNADIVWWKIFRYKSLWCKF